MKRIFFLLLLVQITVVACSVDPTQKLSESSADDGTLEDNNKDDSEESASTYEVFLLIGQSNMAGRGPMVAGDENVYSDNVYLLNAEGKPELAKNPLNRYSSVGKAANLQQIGPGFGFSKKLAQIIDRKILLVVNARAETEISQWLPDASTGYLTEAVKRARTALSNDGKLVAILWHQGCSDSINPSKTEDYMDNLKKVASYLRKELDANGVPFIAGELPQWRPSSAVFNQNLSKIMYNIPFADFVSSQGCTCVREQNDDPHFSRDGQILLGERYAAKVLELCYAANNL